MKIPKHPTASRPVRSASLSRAGGPPAKPEQLRNASHVRHAELRDTFTPAHGRSAGLAPHKGDGRRPEGRTVPKPTVGGQTTGGSSGPVN